MLLSTIFLCVSIGTKVLTSPIQVRRTMGPIITANFNNLTPSPIVAANTVPVPYLGLNFTSFIYQNAGIAGLAKGVVPQSGKIYIANGLLSPNRTPRLSIKGTNTRNFDLLSFYYGCLLVTENAQVQASKACTFEISGVKAPSGQSVGPNSFKYTPGSLTAATMEKATFDSTFVGLQSVSVKLTIPDAEVPLTVFLSDTFQYVLR
ncbi:MAG: hypothetical protein L6R41_002132 [Letrouitia leprolyta]|nr:MAG: hypothetical protein L6R41_002132 [Letrouitia leprolyta]